MSATEQRSQALLDAIDDATARILTNQLKLVSLASNEHKNLPTLAAETVDIEACSSNIVRAVEDLLSISRGLKEAWVLGQVVKGNSDAPWGESENDSVSMLIERLASFHKLQ